jgi:hypothetical protein
MWEKNKIELNAAIEDTEARVDFHFTNTGPHPVKILKTRTSCGCTVAETFDTPYQPGQQGKVSVVFTFGDRQGTYENKITVETAEILPDGKQSLPQIHHLSLTVNIPHTVKIQPNFLFWLPGDPPNPKTARVVVADPLNIEVLGIRVGDPKLDAKFKTITPQKEYEITITPNEETLNKGTMSLVIVETTLKNRRFVLFVTVMSKSEKTSGSAPESGAPLVIPLPSLEQSP